MYLESEGLVDDVQGAKSQSRERRAGEYGFSVIEVLQSNESGDSIQVLFGLVPTHHVHAVSLNVTVVDEPLGGFVKSPDRRA